MADVETHVESYIDALLKRGQRFALKVGGGKWVFGISRDYVDVGPFNFYRINNMVTGASTFSMGVGAAAAYHRLRDKADNDLFWEKDTGFMLQAFIGIAPPDLRMFLRYPSGIPQGALSEIKPSAIDQESKWYIDGNEAGSPHELPTSRFELMMPKQQEVDFGLYNMTPDTVVPQLNIFIRRHRVNYYNIDEKDGIDKKIIQNIIDGNMKARWWSPGVQTFEYDSKEKLGVRAVEVKWR